MDVSKIATNLQKGLDGIWVSRNPEQVSYPEWGNAWAFEIENESYWFQHRNHCITTVMNNFPPPGALFDIGGGNGFVASALQTTGRDVVVLEPGEIGARNAKDRGISSVIRSTFEAAGFVNNSIPAVGLFDVVEHIEDDTGFLEALRSAMVVGGRLYLTVPAYDFLWSAADDLAHHYRRYAISQLDRKLRRTGFAVEFATYIFAALIIPIFVFRALPRKLGVTISVFLEKEKQIHRMPAGVMGNLLRHSFDAELALLRRKRTIPFGGSCLVVARKR
ncbi:MAG: methyltransferase domain-containing protein [Verrucomicrobiia bacterium]